MIHILIIVIMMMITGSTMNGHFIVEFVVREREVEEVLQRIRKTHISRPLTISPNIRHDPHTHNSHHDEDHRINDERPFIVDLLFGSARPETCFNV